MHKGSISLALFCAFLVIGCATSHGPGPDGETHFLVQCEKYCDEGLDCICGVCTKICDTEDQCSRYFEEASCVAASQLVDARACRPADPVKESVCDVSCENDDACGGLGSGYFCQSGFCRSAKLSDSLLSSPDESPVTDGDDLTSDAATGFQIPELNQELDAEFVEPQGHGNWIGGWPMGSRAPAPGEAPANPYGEPTLPSLDDVPPGFECSYYSNMGLEILEEYGVSGLTGGSNCIDYNTCTKVCSQDSDCEDGGSGNAQPRCIENQGCKLSCDEEATCPDGMACLRDSADLNICYWPVDATSPGCPAYCATPKGCPGFCADEGVGCDPDQQDYCCDGLVCGPDGRCVEE